MNRNETNGIVKPDSLLVNEIVHNVRTGIRSKKDLRRCDCPECREALKILGA